MTPLTEPIPHRTWRRTPCALSALVLLTAGLSGYAGESAKNKALAKRIVFVCEHGTVKSVMAMQLFNRLATERGLAIRAVSRGIKPDAAVPMGIAQNLAKDGLALTDFHPEALSKADLSDGARIIAIGVETASVTKGTTTLVESWNDIPAASQDYAAARDAMRARIEHLLSTYPAVKDQGRPRKR